MGLPGFPDIFGGVPIPAFAGVRLSTTAKGWIPVAYKDPIEGRPVTFRALPVVFAIYEARSGTPPPQRVSIPPPTLSKVAGISQITGIAIPNPPAIQGVTIPNPPAIPAVSVPAVSIPPIQIPYPEGGPLRPIAQGIGFYAERAAVRAGFSAFGALANYIGREGVGAPLETVINGEIVAAINRGLANVQSQMNTALARVTSAINQGLKNATDSMNQGFGKVTGAINTGLKNATDSVNQGLGRATSGINQGLGNVNASLEAYQKSLSDALASGARATENAINDVLPQLWKLLGLDQGVVGSLAAIRNVTQASVEVFSPGGGGTSGGGASVIHIFAMGARA